MPFETPGILETLLNIFFDFNTSRLTVNIRLLEVFCVRSVYSCAHLRPNAQSMGPIWSNYANGGVA